MRHHYWEWPIASYLFLGGVGGGTLFLEWLFIYFVYPDNPIVPMTLAWPTFVAIVCLAAGCFLLVFELGQPLVFLRTFIKNTSIICWGARLLTVAMIGALLFFFLYLPFDFLAPLQSPIQGLRDIGMWCAGICGLGVVLYTGIMLSSLKAHSFWATPVLPVLFTISALSTSCALITLAIGWWPAPAALAILVYSEAIRIILHIVDIILIIAEIIVLLVMVLSFLGAGNKTANKVAKRWVKGSYAIFFWVGMLCIGLGAPLVIYIGAPETFAAQIVAPALVLFGGVLLRFMVVYSDDRAPLPGEVAFYTSLPKRSAKFLHAWTKGDNLY